MEYLVVVSIGPVQSFIGSARKLEDFWSGSYLLSDITRRSINIFKNHRWDNQCLIQPKLIKNLTVENFDMAALPNRFLIKVETTGNMVEQMKKIEAEIRHMVYLLLKNYVKKYFNHLSLETEILLSKQIDEQLSDLLELYWAFIPYRPEQSFSQQREELEENLASVKNIRQANYNVEYGLPCTMCGQRSALTKKAIDNGSSYAEMKASLRELWSTIDSESRKVSRNETLCAVCTAKRQQRAVLEDKLTSDGLKLTQTGFPSISYFVNKSEAVRDAINKQNTYDIEFNKNDQEVERYYAMIKFDGDNMGKWIAVADSLEEASEKTERLTNFAQKGVIEAKKDKRLRVVYSGGDDVLAVGSVVDILRFTARIRENFSDEHLGVGSDRTASAGIVIAPETYPLQSVIQYANQAEGNAKEYKDFKGREKNAFSILFIRRSGQQRQIVLPFELEGSSSNLLSYILQTATFWKQLSVSRSFIYHFQNSFQVLNDEYNREKISKQLAFYDKPELIESEFNRLIHNLSELNDRTYITQLSKELTALYCKHQGNFLEFIHLLEIIFYISSNTDLANDKEVHDAL